MIQDINIYDAIHSQLVTGQFESETRIKATKLAEEFNCAANTIRDILMRLATVGLVDYVEQRGFWVPSINKERQHQLTHLRIVLECEGAILSIRQGGIGWESRLSAAHHKLSHIEQRVGQEEDQSHEILSLWANAEREFHQTLIDACRSDVLKDTHERIYHQFRQQIIGKDRKFRYVPENIEQHKHILEAALERDEQLIAQRITGHLSRNLAYPLPEPVPAKNALQAPF